MDEPCSYDDLRACLRDISQVNELTGAYRPTLDWLNALYAKMPYQEKPLHIVDVGCGYGDMLRRIQQWATDRNLPVVLTGIDNESGCDPGGAGGDAFRGLRRSWRGMRLRLSRRWGSIWW